MDELNDARDNEIPVPRFTRTPNDWIHPSKVKRSRRSRIWSAINRNPVVMLTGLICLYLIIVCTQATTKLLWGDELITLAVARQGSFAAIWHALALGADPNPPLMHWLVMISTNLFGQSAFAVRLPAIFCVLLAIVSLWIILRRWLSTGYAAIGVLAFMATRGFDYSYDARSYAPLMGFCMAALAFWLASNDRQGRPRLLALTGMAAALTLGLSSNYYGVLAFFPIAAGEAVRAYRARRFEPGAWIAMAVATLPLLAYLPLIRHNIAEFTPHAWNPPNVGMVFDSYIELVEGIFWPVLGFTLYFLWKRGIQNPPAELPAASKRKPALRAHEAVALGALLLYPVLGLCIAACGAGMVSPRCVAPVCCGFGIATALMGRRIFGGKARTGLILLFAALFWVVARESACAILLNQQNRAFMALRDEAAHDSGDRPIIVTDSLFALPLAHYSSKEMRARIIFPIDFDAIHRTEKDDSGEQNLWAGRNGIFPFRIVPNDPSIFAVKEVLIISRYRGWVPQQLVTNGFTLSEEAFTWSQSYTWHQLGGVFTPMAHEETRILDATRDIKVQTEGPKDAPQGGKDATTNDKELTNDFDKYIMIKP